MLFSVPSEHFNSDDYDSAATYGKLRHKIMYTTKGPTHEHGNKINRKHEPLIPVPRILHAYQTQANAYKITRTLQDIGFRKGWHSIWASLLTTYENKTPRSKTAQNTLHGRYSIQASLLAADHNKTRNLEIDRALPQDAPTYLQPTNKPIINTIHPLPRSSTAKSRAVALAIRRRLAQKRLPQQGGANRDGRTKRCGRTKGAKRKRPCQANQHIMHE